MNNTQRQHIERTWTAETGMSIPQYVEVMEAELIGYANADLATARKDRQNMHIVAQTQVGTVTIIYRRKDGVNPNTYIMNFPGSSVPMTKKAAVEFLVNNYVILKAGA